jgi:diacylglycerol kinase family enzyme
VRALLIVNPHATSTTRPRRDVIVHALASAVDLEVVETRYRGDATRLAAKAAADKFGLVMTLGGDGTVNEAVNGLRSVADANASSAADLPALAALPGGNANVFSRSMRLPEDPIDATAQVLDDLAASRESYIGLGTANGRYFTFNAGLGLDAEVVRAVEGRREGHGQSLAPGLFTMMALRQFWWVSDRKYPALEIQEPANVVKEAVFACIVSNSAPWTYLGRRPVHTNPDARFDSGLDLFALRSLATLRTIQVLAQMLSKRTTPPRGAGVVTAHDLDVIAVTALRPMAFQVDGEYMGETEMVEFRSVPCALRVIGVAPSLAAGLS